MSKNTQQKKVVVKEDKDNVPAKSAKVVKTEKKEVSKTEEKPVTKSEAKADAKPEVKAKAAPRRNLNEAVAFIYGGHFKANRVFVFAVPCKDVKIHYLENYSTYYGKSVSCRYVKCESSDDIFKKVIEKASADKVQPEENINILELSVSNASKLLQEMSEYNKTHTQKISDVTKTTVKKDAKKPANGKKNSSADDEDDGGDEDGGNEDDGDEDGGDEDGGDEDGEDEEEEEEEEEEKPQAKKAPAKKPVTKGGKKA
jgi:hypothetical protein